MHYSTVLASLLTTVAFPKSCKEFSQHT